MYKSLGQYEKAMEHHKKHLSICQKTGDLPGEGRSYGNIGNVYDWLGQYEKAMEYHKKDLSICQKTGDLAGQGASNCNIGSVNYVLGQYGKAMEYYMKSLSIFQEKGDLAGKGKANGNIGMIYMSLGQYEKAMEYQKIYLSICQKTGDLAGEGKAYSNIGIVYMMLGQYEKALEYHKIHLSICREIGDLVREGISYCSIGNVHFSLGQYEKAMEYHKKHLSICQETRDLAGEGKSYGNIGNVYQSLGQYEKAMEYHKKHLSICQKTGDFAGEGKSYGNIGNVYYSLGQYEKAMEYYKKHLSICQKTGDLAGEGKSYCNIGIVCLSDDDICGGEANLKESLRCFQEIFKSLHEQDDYKVSIVDTYIVVYRELTEVLVSSGKEEEALLVSERGRSQALRDKLMMKYGLLKGEEDNELFNKDIDSLVSSRDSSFLFLCILRYQVSMFVIEQGKELYLRETLPDSFSFCRAKSDGPSTELRDILTSYVNKILQDTKKHLSARNNSCEDRLMNEHQDQYHLQHLALGDILDVESVTKIKEELLEDSVTSCVSSYSTPPTEHSDNSSAISEPQSQEAQTSQEVTGTTTPESEDEKRSEMELPNDDQDGAKVLEKLYQVLIAPVQEALTEPEIVIIPDGPFFFVPFAALMDKNGTFLSETKRIRIGPSLATLKLLKECPAEKHCKTGALIVGGPKTGVVMYAGKKRTFSDLPFARREARIIGQLLGEKTLTGSSATKDEVKRRLREGVSIIHIATHGDADTGELVLAPGPCADKMIPKEEDYMLTVNDIYSSRINAQLVVLSCCHSGRGKIRAEGVVGLTRAFLAAGARSVLATLWAIDDRATVHFMNAFYRHLKNGESASASLQQAMKEIREIPVLSHPYFWAPFFIVGDDIRITT